MTNITSNNQSGGITAGHVEIKKNKKQPSILNNPWIITIIGGTIVGTILLIIQNYVR